MTVKAQTDPRTPHLVIIGGGFGGLYAARAAARLPLRITLVDRKNHHTFQPLLYQVASAVLSPADIASPIRSVLRRQRNSPTTTSSSRPAPRILTSDTMNGRRSRPV